MKQFKEFLPEGFGRQTKRTTALLPATRALFNKNKVSIKDILNDPSEKDGGKSTIQVAHLKNDPKNVRYIKGYGHIDHEEGKVIHAHHDQTGNHLGAFHVKNTIHINNGKIKKSHKAVDADTKAPLLVYK